MRLIITDKGFSPASSDTCIEPKAADITDGARSCPSPDGVGAVGKWPYIWLDATYVKVRRDHHIVSVAVIVAVGVNID